MRSGSLTAGGLAVCAALLTACGGAEEEAAQAARKAPKPASAAVIDGAPYAISCAHVRDQQTWAGVTRRATVAIGNRERIPGLSGLRETQSIFYAMTELCKGRSATFQPADAAVRAVRAGTYRADLGAP
jgi:hypothetical protein